ncbi:MAG TPA: ABC transporter permease, partial [Ktedonobacteraceae bacterium]|nr:ABC transporter permease [Ktedonobacteraceae bacterium]
MSSHLSETTSGNTGREVSRPLPSKDISEMQRFRQRRRSRGLPALFQSGGSAIQAMRANLLRSLLTSLGIIIGVAAVIMVIAISEGSTANINARLSTLNPLQLTIRPGSAATTGVRQGAGTLQSLTQADADALAQLP